MQDALQAWSQVHQKHESWLRFFSSSKKILVVCCVGLLVGSLVFALLSNTRAVGPSTKLVDTLLVGVLSSSWIVAHLFKKNHILLACCFV